MAAPSGGYRITVDSTDISTGIDTTSSPHTITVPQPGVHSIRVVGLSQHFPSETVGPVEVTVRGQGEIFTMHSLRPNNYRCTGSNCQHFITDCHINHHLLESSASSVPSPSS